MKENMKEKQWKMTMTNGKGERYNVIMNDEWEDNEMKTEYEDWREMKKWQYMKAGEAALNEIIMIMK